ncbi:MAG: hypothetical protein ACXV3E_08825, partial [Halobacteriota archaeon]
IARGKHKVAVTAVDHDDVALSIEATAPQFSGGPFEDVARQPSRSDYGRAHRNLEAISDRYQGLGSTGSLSLNDRNP